MARTAASLISPGAAKSGKPWARFTPLWRMHTRVMSRMTDSVKLSAFWDENSFISSFSSKFRKMQVEVIYKKINYLVNLKSALAHLQFFESLGFGLKGFGSSGSAGLSFSNRL